MAAENPIIVQAYLAAVAALPAQSEHPVPHPFTIEWNRSLSMMFAPHQGVPERMFSWGPSVPVEPDLPALPIVPVQKRPKCNWKKPDHQYNMVVNGIKYITSRNGDLIGGIVSITGIKFTTELRIDPVGTVIIKNATDQIIQRCDKHIVITRDDNDVPLFEDTVTAETFEGSVTAETLNNHGHSVYITVNIPPVTLYLKEYQHVGCSSFAIYGIKFRDNQ